MKDKFCLLCGEKRMLEVGLGIWQCMHCQTAYLPTSSKEMKSDMELSINFGDVPTEGNKTEGITK